MIKTIARNHWHCSVHQLFVENYLTLFRQAVFLLFHHLSIAQLVTLFCEAIFFASPRYPRLVSRWPQNRAADDIKTSKSQLICFCQKQWHFHCFFVYFWLSLERNTFCTALVVLRKIHTGSLIYEKPLRRRQQRLVEGGDEWINSESKPSCTLP